MFFCSLAVVVEKVIYELIKRFHPGQAQSEGKDWNDFKESIKFLDIDNCAPIKTPYLIRAYANIVRVRQVPGRLLPIPGHLHDSSIVSIAANLVDMHVTYILPGSSIQ